MSGVINSSVTSTFCDVQFPTDISYGSKGGSGFSTNIFTTTAGFEQRNINWQRSKGRWDVSYGIKTVDQMNELIAFFMAMQGRAFAFRFKDWADYQIVNTTIGTGDGTTTGFALSKTYTVTGPGGTTYGYTRPILKPVAGSLSGVLVNGVPDTGATVDPTTGLITPSTVPGSGHGIFVTYAEFDVPCRFDTDTLDIVQDFWEVESFNSIPIVEVRI